MGTSAGTKSSLAGRAASRVWPGDLAGSDFPPSSARILALGVWLAVLGGVVQGVVHIATYRRDGYMLNADNEGNVWSWASSSTTFAAGVAALVLLAVRSSATAPFAVLAGTLFFMSMDDAIALHERVDSLGPIDFGAPVVWPFVYVPALAGFVLIWTLAQVVPRRAGRLLRIGLVLLVAAIVIEIPGGWLDHGAFMYNVEVAVEEGLELVAWVLVASALFATSIAWAATARTDTD